MLFQALIERKRDGGVLTAGEWRNVVEAYGRAEVPDYQMAALLMAVTLRGLTAGELASLTDAMLTSGARLDFGDWSTPRVDKHSTGGVGDKVSLVLAPLAASCGLAVPMMSGRGLGHTGGTTDKLEAIPGFRTSLSLAEVREQVQRIGVAMFGQTAEIAPADARLYALRDVTGTVPSIPLIAASIMSKKLAEGLQGLVLDVKVGSGALLPDPDRARDLARTMVGIGEAHGCRTIAILSAMDRPLGRAIGNALEVEEALAALGGNGPEDLLELTRVLAAEMLVVGRVATDQIEARRRVDEALVSGRALETFRSLIQAQGGDPAIADDPSALPQAAVVELFEAPWAGVITRVDPRRLGMAVVELGGGRRHLGDAVDHSVGFVVTARPGSTVVKGEPIASVFARDAGGAAIGLTALREAITVADPGSRLDSLPLVGLRFAGEEA